jgi:TolA-binding protein
MAARSEPMFAPKPLSRPYFRSSPRSPRGVLAAACLCLGALSASAQDQVSWLDNSGRAKTSRGVVTENTLDHTTIAADGRDRKVGSSSVVRVVFGDVPPSYQEGVAYFDRQDFENAAAKFQVAASDASARAVVQASARMYAAQAWMRRGSGDPGAFAEAEKELERFLADHADDRQVPTARYLLGRAKWLKGDAVAAAEVLKSLYGEVQADQATKGYSLEVCYGAGVAAAQASLAGGDTDGARALFNEVATALTSVLAGMDATSPTGHALTTLQANARLGEGHCLLASGSTSQAKTFFQGQLNSASRSGAQRFGARLGLAEALFAEGRFREAEIEFAKVSAIDHSDRDRVARALVGLAECALQLADTSGRQMAKTWLQTVQQRYGDTPSLIRARELEKNL